MSGIEPGTRVGRLRIRAAADDGVLYESQRDPTYIPAAIDLLAQAGELIPFMSMCTAAQTAALILPMRKEALPNNWRTVVPEAAHPALAEEQRTLIATALIL